MNIFLPGFLKNRSVRTLIVLTFTAEILFFALLTGYFSYTSGLHTVAESANKITAVVNDDIKKTLLNYLEDPYQLEQINKSILLNQQLDFSNQAQRDKHFVEMLKIFPRVLNNYVVLASGYEYGARQEDDGNFVVWSSDKEKQTLDYYQYDNQLGRRDYIKSLLTYDPCRRPPYLKAIAMANPGWTDVYASATGRGLVITKVCPVYTPDKQLVGVLSSSLLLKWIDGFLQSLPVTKHSSVFILSHNGDIIASTGEALVDKKRAENPAMLVNAAAVPLLAQGISALKEKVPSIQAVNQDTDLNFQFNGEKFFLHAYPIQGKNDLQWISIILIPEKDLTYYMGDFVNQLIFITIFACILGLITGTLSARYIIRPIVKMNQVAKKIGQGDFSDKIELRRDDEIGQLVYSMNIMSTQLEIQLEQEKQAAETHKRMCEQQAALNRAAGSFVPYAFLYMLGKQDILEIAPGDHVEKEITILFTDIRSYTSISENMTNNELFEFINSYLDLAVDIITIHNGFIDKFIGDAIMGLFPDGVDDSLRAIIELRRQLQQRTFANVNVPIQTGVGIHFGSVTLGTIGTYTRMDTTVLGDSVNLASRLESATKVYGIDILLSEPAYCRLQQPEQFHIREVDTVKVKGKSVPIKLYEVFDCDSDELKELKIRTAPLFAQGLELYKTGDFARADEIFRHCRELCPADQLLSVYIKRCGTMQRIPPGPDWKGVSGI